MIAEGDKGRREHKEGREREEKEKKRSPGLVGKGLISTLVLSLFSKMTLGKLFNLYKPTFLICKIEIMKEPTS